MVYWQQVLIIVIRAAAAFAELPTKDVSKWVVMMAMTIG